MEMSRPLRMIKGNEPPAGPSAGSKRKTRGELRIVGRKGNTIFVRCEKRTGNKIRDALCYTVCGVFCGMVVVTTLAHLAFLFFVVSWPVLGWLGVLD